MDNQERKEVLDTVRDPTRDDWPAELRELPTEKLRQFTLHYIASGNGAAACRAAGYLTPDHPAEAFAKCAYKLLLRDDVVAALGALAKRQIRSLAPRAVDAIRETLDQPFSPNRLRAAGMVLDRTDAVTQKVDVTHTHKFDPIKVTLQELARLKRQGATADAIMLALDFQSPFELEHYEALLAKEEQPIDAEYRELPAPAPAPDPDDELLGVSHGPQAN